jgi:hypothetical protein
MLQRIFVEAQAMALMIKGLGVVLSFNVQYA